MKTTYIGAAIGNAAGKLGCQLAPDLIRSTFNLSEEWKKTVVCHSTSRQLEAMASTQVFSQELANVVGETIKLGELPLVIGGDHSCAIGTWSGVHQQVPDFGLIWIDAHLDANTPLTSPSGNIHGMPVAALLGKIPELLSKKAVNPDNLVFMGIRDYDAEEYTFLRSLGVKIYSMTDLKGYSFPKLMLETEQSFTRRGLPYGISLDLDGLDPSHMTGLGTPVEDGIQLHDLLEAFSQINHAQLCALEITEYNPTLDNNSMEGLHVIAKILSTVGQLKNYTVPFYN